MSVALLMGLMGLNALLFACSGASPGQGRKPIVHKILIPARAETAGDEMLKFLPTGADLLLELDLRRLRENPVVGPLVRSLKVGAGGLDGALLTKTDVVVVAAYNVGTAQAATLTLVRGEHIRPADVGSAVKVDATTVALGPTVLVKQIRLLAAGKVKSVKIDRKLMRARALAMPPKATTGALRVSGNLDSESRSAMARTLKLDQVPATISVWGDVIDDLAIVALLGGAEQSDGQALVYAATKWRGRLVRNAIVRKLLLGHLVRRLDIGLVGSMARVVLLVGPKRLNKLTRRLTKEPK